MFSAVGYLEVTSSSRSLSPPNSSPLPSRRDQDNTHYWVEERAGSDVKTKFFKKFSRFNRARARASGLEENLRGYDQLQTKTVWLRSIQFVRGCHTGVVVCSLSYVMFGWHAKICMVALVAVRRFVNNKGICLWSV